MKKRYLVGLLAVFIAFSLLGAKCQRVTDPSSAEYSLPYEGQTFRNMGECISWCNKYYKEMLLEENERHREAMQACEDPQCKNAETKIHQENVKRIQWERAECRRSCHDQGSVGGGF